MCEGVGLTVASTGIGAPSTAVVFEELVKLGGHTFIRVGNSGALSPEVALGDYVISSASVRDDGTSRCYVETAYPAAAQYEVVAALAEEAKKQGHAHHVGVTWSTDAFYARNKVLLPDGSLGSMSVGGYSQHGMVERMEDMRRARVLNIEMESGVIFTLASLFGARAGCICTVSDRCPWPGPGLDMISLDRNIHGAIDVARAAMLRLAR
jgi:uridine phosphorylase